MGATLCPAGFIALRATTEAHVVDVCQSLTVGELGFASDKRRTARIAPESAALLPRGVTLDVVAKSRPDGLLLEFDDANASTVSYEVTDGRFGSGPIVYEPDPVIGALTRQMLAWLRCPDTGRPAGDAFVEGLMIAMVARSVERSAGVDAPRPVDANVSQMRYAIEMIEARLGDRLMVQDLASAVGMSPAAFQCAFKVRMGEPPHRYIQRRRVERAIEMIRTTKSPLSQIAHQTGFSSQSHMGAAVKAACGVTPRSLRLD